MITLEKSAGLWLLSLMLLQHNPTVAQRPASVAQAPPGEILTLPEALGIAAANYPLLRAKQHYASASKEMVRVIKMDALPNVTVSVENGYGTLNGLNGLSSGLPGLTTLTSGPSVASQNWNAAFGGLYVSNVDWNLWSFGSQRAHVAASRGQYEQDLADLSQERFVQSVRVTGSYLDLLGAQRLRMVMEANLQRAAALRNITLQKTENGLNAGVDSALANAELSSARLSLLEAEIHEKKAASQLAVQLGLGPQVFKLDSSFYIRMPRNVSEAGPPDAGGHPVLQFLQSRKRVSDLNANYLKRTGLPRLSLFMVGQTRGSGFASDYASNQKDYSTGYFTGIKPIRTNYLIGMAVTWGVTDFARTRSAAAAQRWTSEALQDEYDAQEKKLINESALAADEFDIALARYREAPIQLQAARAAYSQKRALYENGLISLAEVAQALYILNRAEIDEYVACNAVWQALLSKASAAGDMDLLLKQL